MTVDGDIYIIGNQRLTVNMNSYWAVVKSEVNGTMYTVVDSANCDELPGSSL